MDVPVRELLLGQGAYYAVTGLWPLAHLGSFLRVTGPKSDLWLVRTVGLLVAAVGASLLAAGYRAAPGPETVVLAAGCALALAGVDVVYSVRGRISLVYLLDALAQGAILWFWSVAATTR